MWKGNNIVYYCTNKDICPRYNTCTLSSNIIFNQCSQTLNSIILFKRYIQYTLNTSFDIH